MPGDSVALMGRRIFYIVAALVAVVAVAWLGAGEWVRRSIDRRGAAGPSAWRIRVSSHRRPSPLGGRPEARAPAELSREAFRRKAASLEGTSPDGGLTTGADGHFVVTRDARRFFDYFLMAVGELSPREIRARIVAEIKARLGPPAVGEAIAFLDRYFAFRERGRQLAEEGGAAENLEGRFARIRALRRESFGESEAEALFGEEERVQRADLARYRIMRDKSLSAEDRRRRLAEAEQELPEEVRARRAAAGQALRLRQDETALREAGGSAEEIYALREQMVGDEAAGRLDALDQRRMAWKRRVDAFRTERDAVQNDASLDPAERDRAIAALMANRFSAPERIRVQALDRIEMSRPPATKP